MSRSKALRPVAAVAALAGVALVSLAVVASPAAEAAPLPWQSGSLVDPNEKGALALYDATGHAVTSGSIDAPLAAYAVGSATLHSGDTLAQLSLYTVSDAQVPLDAPIASPAVTTQAPAAGWVGESVTGPTSYPLASGPTLPSGPVATIAGTDVTLGQHIAGYPNTSTKAGYTNVYELRLTTTTPGKQYLPEYDAVDIKVTGSTWAIVDSIPDSTPTPTPTPTVTPPKATAVTLTSSSATVPAGHPFVLKGVVSPAAAGRFDYYDGATLKAKVAVGSTGVAQYVPNFSYVSNHPVTIKFVPTDPEAFNGSTSNQVTVTVTKANANVKPTWPAFYSTKTASLPVSVTTIYPVGTGTTELKYGGWVYLFDGTKRIAAGTLTNQRVTLAVPKLTKGVHTLTVQFLGNSSVNAKTITVKVTVR